MAIKKTNPSLSEASKGTKSAQLSPTSKPQDANTANQTKKSPCCMDSIPCGSSGSSKTNTLLRPEPTIPAETKKGPKTRITIKYDVGFNNSLFLRGKGANLSWDRGVSLKNVKADEWVWETEAPFSTCEFKVLINDKQYEVGNNHTLICGASIQYTPKF